MGLRTRFQNGYVAPEAPKLPDVKPKSKILDGVPEQHRRVVAMHAMYCTKNVPAPKQMEVAELLALAQSAYEPGNHIEQAYRNRIRSPLTGIRAFCVMCANGPKAASDCKSTTCALWPFRRGTNPFFNRLKGGDSASED